MDSTTACFTKAVVESIRQFMGVLNTMKKM